MTSIPPSTPSVPALDQMPLLPDSFVLRPRRRWRNSSTFVLAATLMFAGVCLSFLMNTPLLQSPDELFHFDRVMASAQGHLTPDPGRMNLSIGSAGAQNSYLPAPRADIPPLEQFAVNLAPVRDLRRSYDELGGDDRTSTVLPVNYLTQHPPLYYAILGGFTRLLPHADSMPTDLLMWILKLLNIFMVLPLPYLMYRSSRVLVGDTAVAQSAAFLPLLVPGLARGAASLNNDNLAILIGAAVIALSLAVARGNQSTRTALWIAGLCIAGSLTKSTVLFVLVVVPIAYLIATIRLRRLPARPALVALLAGAVGSAAWWFRNDILFGQFQPDGYGRNVAAITGNARPPGQPAALRPFVNAVMEQIPSRFWAGLGLGGPPSVPNSMIWLLTIATFLAAFVAVFVLRGRRIDVLMIFAVGLAAVAMVCFTSWRHWVHYNAILGLQGRYAYPSVFGVLFPLTVLGALLLGRWWKLTPPLIAIIGSLVSGWAIYTSADLFWLLPGQALTPSDWAAAIRRLLSWSAVPPVVGIAILLVAAISWVGGAIVSGYCAIRNAEHRGLRAVLLAIPNDMPGPADHSAAQMGFTSGPEDLGSDQHAKD